jgi:hypothetical protein
LAAVVGSGIIGERLAAGFDGLIQSDFLPG